MQTHIFALCDSNFTLKKLEKKGGHAASYIVALFMTLDGRIVRPHHFYGWTRYYKVKNLVEPKQTVVYAYSGVHMVFDTW